MAMSARLKASDVDGCDRIARGRRRQRKWLFGVPGSPAPALGLG